MIVDTFRRGSGVVQRKESWLGTYRYPAEFRADAVALARSSGRPIAQVVRELGVPSVSGSDETPGAKVP